MMAGNQSAIFTTYESQALTFAVRLIGAEGLLHFIGFASIEFSFFC